MRYIYTATVVLLAAAVIVFCLQNSVPVGVSYLGWSIDIPLPLLVVIVYMLGMATGGAVLTFLRRSLRGAASRPKQT